MSTQDKKGRLLILNQHRQHAPTTDGAQESSEAPLSPAIDLTALRQERKRLHRLDQKAHELKNLSDQIHSLIMSHVKAGSLEAHELAALLTHYAKDLVALSFPGMEPEEKRKKRDQLSDCLAKMLQRPQGMNPPSPTSPKGRKDLRADSEAPSTPPGGDDPLSLKQGD